jgi:uracil-DNA glycosylase
MFISISLSFPQTLSLSNFIPKSFSIHIKLKSIQERRVSILYKVVDSEASLSISFSSSEMLDLSSSNEEELYTDSEHDDMIILPKGWENFFINFKEELNEIFYILQERIIQGIEIFPKFKDVLRPFYETPLSDVRVVILGREPYHNPNQANGLAFSVNKGDTIPLSLANIFLEISREIKEFRIPEHGDLTNWSKQGIFLLNQSFTVERKKEISHDMVWRGIVRKAIKLCSNKGGVIFVLWGKEASTFDKDIDTSVNTILKSAHPSPYSANKGFFGNNHFKMINELLDPPIDWNI